MGIGIKYLITLILTDCLVNKSPKYPTSLTSCHEIFKTNSLTFCHEMYKNPLTSCHGLYRTNSNLPLLVTFITAIAIVSDLNILVPAQPHYIPPECSRDLQLSVLGLGLHALPPPNIVTGQTRTPQAGRIRARCW